MAGAVDVPRFLTEQLHGLVDGRPYSGPTLSPSRHPETRCRFFHSRASTESAVKRASVNQSPLQ